MIQKDKNWHSLPFEEVIKQLGSNAEEGLSEREVRERQKKFGLNELPKEKPLSTVKIFFEQFQSPLIYILVLAGFTVLLFQKYTDAIVIFGAVFLNVLVGFFQENKSSKALRSLRKVVKQEARVIREGNEKVIDATGLVSGDIFELVAGDKVPVDGRLIETHNLKINQSALTGEWLADEKRVEVISEKTSLADRENMVYMGTIVEDGKGRAVVIGIGLETEIGKVAKMIREVKEEKTPLQRKLARFSRLVGAVIFMISALIFYGGIVRQKDFLEMFETAVAVAIAAIPEGLPVAMTVILALGMQKILKRKGLVRKLLAAETLGSTSVIATDKTLTLTEGKMVVSEISTAREKLSADTESFTKVFEEKADQDQVFALRIAVLANEAFVENPKDPLVNWKVQGRPTDKALILFGAEVGFRKQDLEKEFSKIDEISFNTQNKFIATLTQKTPSRQLLFVSGAPEKIISLSSYFQEEGKTEALEEKDLFKLSQELENLTRKGLRVIAVAYKEIPNSPPKASLAKGDAKGGKFQIPNLRNEVNDLVFVGFIGLKDPLRKGVKEAIQTVKKAGIRPIIVTGDHRLTAKAVAEELGFKTEEKNIIEGKELDELSDEELEKRLKEIQIYARVEPKDKIRIIQAWQRKGEVVAMTGDGINDAPALKQADIGIALGSGTDVAKEVSDLILLPDSFNIIVAAVEEGRVILDNIRKVITYLLSDSFTEVILIGTAIIFGLPLPVTAVQILWVNLIEDGLPSVALAFEPKEKDVMERKPRGKDVPLLTKEMKAIIFIIGTFTSLILLGIFLWLLRKFGLENLDYIRTMVFAGLGVNSLFYIFSCKSLRRNIWQINLFSNKFLIGGVAFGFFMLISGIHFPLFQTLLKTVPLGFQSWMIILSLGLINVILIEAMKWYFISKKEFK